MYNAHLLDPRDGYTVRTVGYPHGVFHGGFLHYGGRVAALPLQPRAARNRLLVFDLATGDLAEDLRFEQAVAPSQMTPHGSRYWPIFAEGQNRACIFDSQTGRLSPMVELPEVAETNEAFQRRAIATKDTLIMLPYQKPMYAFNVADEETLWTYDPPERASSSVMPWGDDRLLVTWPGGAAMLKADDGSELWRRKLPNSHVRAADFAALGNNLFAQTYEQRGDSNIMYITWIDAETGNDVFQFKQAGENYLDVALIDEQGVLIRAQPGRLEYWVSDAEGQWK
jgi:outer membrane protein assembly factor BamB